MQGTDEAATLEQRVAEFKRNGYTVFRGFNAAWIERWRTVFLAHYRRQLGQDQHGSGVGQPRAVFARSAAGVPRPVPAGPGGAAHARLSGAVDGSGGRLRQPADRHHAAGQRERSAPGERLAPRHVGAAGVDRRLPAAQRRERAHLPAGRARVRPPAGDPRLPPRRPRGRRGRSGQRPGGPAGAGAGGRRRGGDPLGAAAHHLRQLQRGPAHLRQLLLRPCLAAQARWLRHGAHAAGDPRRAPARRPARGAPVRAGWGGSGAARLL